MKLLVFIAFFAVLCCGTARAADVAAVATVVEGAGAQVRLSAGAAFKTLAEDTDLPSGATVRTDAASRVEVQFSDNSILRINNMSQVTITVSGKSKTVDTDSGQVWGHVKKLKTGESFDVKTPSVTCGVRGTTFWVEVDAAEGDSVGVEDGEVEVEHRGGKRVRLKKRMRTRMRQGKLEDGAAFDPEKREKWEGFTEKHVQKRFEELDAELADLREQSRAAAEDAEKLVAEVDAFAEQVDHAAKSLKKSLVQSAALVKQADQLKKTAANTIKKGGKRDKKRQAQKLRDKIAELIEKMTETEAAIQNAWGALDVRRGDVKPLLDRAKALKERFAEIRDKNEKLQRRIEKHRKRREFDPQWPKLKKLNDAITDHEDRVLDSSDRLDKVLKGKAFKSLKDVKDLTHAITKTAEAIEENAEEIQSRVRELTTAHAELEEILRKLDAFLNE